MTIVPVRMGVLVRSVLGPTSVLVDLASPELTVKSLVSRY